MATGRGGRKEKSEEQQLTQVVKTTLSKKDLERLQREYKLHRTGQKISFAEYIRQQLLTKSGRKSGTSERSNLLLIQLELAEIGSQLSSVLTEIRRHDGNASVSNMLASELAKGRNECHLQIGLGQNIDRVDAIIKQISQWLYDCSPEKI